MPDAGTPPMDMPFSGGAEKPVRLSGKFCRKCGGPIAENGKRCTVCGKKSSAAGFVIPLTILIVLFLGAAALNVWQYPEPGRLNGIIAGREPENAEPEESVSAPEREAGEEAGIGDLNTQFEEKDAVIEDLNAQDAEKDAAIADLTAQLAEKDDAIADLTAQPAEKDDALRSLMKDSVGKTDAKPYNTLISALQANDLGYAAKNFQVDKSILILKRSEASKKLVLTAFWPDGGSVDFSFSDSSVASLSFDDHNRSTSTTLTVMPKSEGVTAVTFTNDVDSSTLSVIVIVIP